jgi:hypothetical protein
MEGYGFALAGGTSLALRFGHRLSIDLDFFTEAAFEPQDLANRLAVGPESITGSASGTLQMQLRKVKVEFLRHSYPPLAPKEFIQNIHFWSLQIIKPTCRHLRLPRFGLDCHLIKIICPS